MRFPKRAGKTIIQQRKDGGYKTTLTLRIGPIPDMPTFQIHQRKGEFQRSVLYFRTEVSSTVSVVGQQHAAHATKL